MYTDTDPINFECLRFVCMQLIQSELDRSDQHWNLPTIRSQLTNELTQGKPNCLFFIPELYNAHDCGTQIDDCDVNACLDIYSTDRNVCIPEFRELSYLLKPDLQLPYNAEDALRLYFELIALLQ